MLRLEGVDAFYGDLQALFGVSLDVPAGGIFALVGANAAGKSTTLRVVSGLVTPRHGRVLFDGEELARVPAARRVDLGIVQVPEGRRLFPFMTVRENLLLGAHPRRARGERDATLSYVYRLFPVLQERASQLAGSLSGGEQQMCAIGRGLMACPRLLMLDEPSLGLAPVIVRAIFEALARINQEGMTVLLVEQNVRRSLELSHRAYVLDNGRTTLEGSGAALLASPHVKQAYLGL